MLQYHLSNVKFILQLVDHILFGIEFALHVIHELLEGLLHLSIFKSILLYNFIDLMLQVALLPLPLVLQLAYLLIQLPYLLLKLLIEGVFELRDLIRMVEIELFLFLKGLLDEVIVAFLTAVAAELHLVVDFGMVSHHLLHLGEGLIQFTLLLR